MMELAELLADPARLADMSAGELLALLVRLASEHHRLAALETAIAKQLWALAPNGEDRLIELHEARQRLGNVSEDWLRRRPDLPFVVKLSDGVVRYSSRGIDRYIAARERG